ncbi:MAG: Adenylate cyclase [Candidatus Ozemobacter sibiricus]|uniref:Adenylate cyclase n=1 Tax=Candidatus Ozemobacter sibiricus TaxID=2268124 RepID=A0A367ZT02_9BACT|nr:MAG: Adenylate cyclase [Candidatus Ozemobacter sibiricus]
MPSRLLSVVFTDIKGFTERTSQAGRDFAVKLREKHDALLKPIIRRYEGTLVKTIGDAFLLTFESPTNAVLCALMMQEALRTYNRTAPAEERIEIRIAINTGEVTVTDGDVLGDVVNVASRVEHITEANEIWFTEATYLAMNKQEVPTSLVGEFRLKGVPEALKIYRVVQDLDSEQFKMALARQQEKLAADAALAAPGRPGLPLPAVGLVAALVLLTLLAILWTWKNAIPPQLLEANRALNSGEPRRAIDAVISLLAEAPNHPQGLELLRRSLEAAVGQHLAKKETAAARALLDDLRARFGSLGPLPDLETDVSLAEAYDLAQQGLRGREQADEIAHRLATEQKDHAPTVHKVARFYHRTGIHGRRSIHYMTAAAAFDPASFAQDPEFLKTMDYFLMTWSPEEGFDETRQFIASHCFDLFAATFTRLLATTDQDSRSGRWNALRIMARRGRPVDPTPVYLAEILNSPGEEDSPLLREAVEYFVAGTGTAALPATFDRFPLLERGLLATDSPSMRLAAGPFFPRLEPWLRRALTDPGSTTARLNAFRVLEEKGIPPDQLWRFHAAQAIDWEGVLRTDNQTRRTLKDAVAYLASHPVPAGIAVRTDPVLAPLREALTALAAAAARYAAHARGNNWQPEFASWQALQGEAEAAASRLPQAR